MKRFVTLAERVLRQRAVRAEAQPDVVKISRAEYDRLIAAQAEREVDELLAKLFPQN